jgi:hypothetical protein
MGTCQSGNLTSSADEVPTSEAAMTTFRQLLGALTGRVSTYASRDGGLICEDRSSPGRPWMWRIAADGALLPDSSYDFALRAFVSVPVPGRAVVG